MLEQLQTNLTAHAEIRLDGTEQTRKTHRAGLAEWWTSSRVQCNRFARTSLTAKALADEARLSQLDIASIEAGKDIAVVERQIALFFAFVGDGLDSQQRPTEPQRRTK
jgi:hypothetical protein